MTNNKTPFVRIIPPLVAGIIIGIWFSPTKLFFVMSFIAISSFLLLSNLLNKSLYNTYYGIIFSVVLVIIGLYLYTKEKQRISILDKKETIIYGTLNDYPIEKAKTYLLSVNLQSQVDADGTMLPISGSIIIYHPKDDLPTDFLPGDRLAIRVTPQDISNRGNPYEFDYKAYMEHQDTRYCAFTKEGDIIYSDNQVRRTLRQRALIVRQHLIDIYIECGIDKEQLPLIAAITLGYKTLLDPDQKEIFSKAGIMHIMAVSGLHAGIVSMLVMGLFFFLKGRLHFLRIILAIISLWAFAFITGLTPSVTRASLMFSFLQIGLLIKRPVNNINSILASAFVLIIIRPSVIFESGFQLSYLAVIYIICMANHFSSKISSKSRIVNYIWQSIIIALIAQIGTLPLTITLFNRFPTWFLLSNVFIIPIATTALVCGLLTLLTYPVPLISSSVAFVTNHLVKITEALTYKAASLPFSTIDNIGMTTPECILLLICIALVSRYIINRKKTSSLLPLISILLLVLAVASVDIKTSRECRLIVYNTTGKTTVGIQQGKHLYVFSNYINDNQEVDKHMAALRLKTKKKEIGTLPLLLTSHDKKILITDNLNNKNIQSYDIDICILTKCNASDDMSSDSTFPYLIIGNEAQTNWRTKAALNALDCETIYFVNDNGAFITEL